MSGRADITAGLSALLENNLSKISRPWAKEVTIPVLGNVRPDYVSVSAYGGGLARLDKIEKAVVSIYEIKSCLADFRSGSGLNAVGDANWIVLPYELHTKLIAGDYDMPNYFGIAYPYPVSHGRLPDRLQLPAYEGQVDGWRLHWSECTSLNKYYGRKAPLEAFLWSMMYAGVRR